MAVLTVIKFVLSFALAYILYMIFTPIIFQTRYENSMWDDMPVSIQAWGDQIYGIWILIIIIIAGIISLAAWAESSRQRALQQ